jgi:hypothetical protein
LQLQSFSFKTVMFWGEQPPDGPHILRLSGGTFFAGLSPVFARDFLWPSGGVIQHA